MGIYTFVVEKDGGTYIEQFSGRDVMDVATQWCSQSRLIRGEVKPADPEPSPVESTRNVWCLTGFDGADEFYLVHITGPIDEDGSS